MERTRGELVPRGRAGKAICDTRRGQRNVFLASMFFLSFVGVLLVLRSLGYTRFPSEPGLLVLLLPLAGLILLAVYFLPLHLHFWIRNRRDIHKGPDESEHISAGRLKGKAFARFEDTEGIEYGTYTTRRGETDFLRVIGEEGPLLKPFLNWKYQNDF